MNMCSLRHYLWQQLDEFNNVLVDCPILGALELKVLENPLIPGVFIQSEVNGGACEAKK